jgi:hypothetical protein
MNCLTLVMSDEFVVRNINYSALQWHVGKVQIFFAAKSSFDFTAPPRILLAWSSVLLAAALLKKRRSCGSWRGTSRFTLRQLMLMLMLEGGKASVLNFRAGNDSIESG